MLTITKNLYNLKTMFTNLDEKGERAYDKLLDNLDEQNLARCGILDTNNFSIWGTVNKICETNFLQSLMH